MAAVVAFVATGAVSASSISASAPAGHANVLTCLNGGTVKKTLWTPAPNGAQPGQIAQFGHLQAGQSVAMTDTAVNGKNQCIANVPVYLALQEQAGGDTVTITNPSQCGGITQLPAAPSGYGVNPTWITCTTDANGQVDMTYTAPNPAPAYANVEINDCISIADETTSECAGYPPKYYTISFRTWYQFLEQYQFNLSPVAPSGSLIAGQSVPITFTAVGVDGTPQMNTQVWLEESGAQSGTTTAGITNTPLTSTFQAFMTDSNGQIPLTYTAPPTLPTTGIDTIVAQSDTTTAPAVYNSSSYAYTSGYPTVSIGDVTTTEGDTPTAKTKGATALFELTLSAAQTAPVTVQYFTYCGIGDKACSEDILEAKTPRTVTIAAGKTSVQIKQIIYSYPELEPYTESYYLQLTGPVGAILGRSTGEGTLLGDNEKTSAPLLYAGGAAVVCGAGTQTAYAVVILSSPQSSAVGFHYMTSDGSAFAGTDYTATSGSASIPAGGTQFTIPVPILPCTTPGPTKTFSITISSPTGPATIQLATGTGTVLNII
ncbi:MAG: Calx-beta domain-containing protein [Candidatus Dormiibacterota bacterium]